MCTAEDNDCVAATDDDCRQSEKCIQQGQCVAKFGMCVM